MPDRRVAPAVVAVAIVVLAAVSLPELHLEYAPDVRFPELRVRLQLPPDAAVDSAETTRRWVIPIESALRAAGDTTGTRGEIDAGSALIVARFKRGTDLDIKAARIASDLAPLRRQLPQRATLSIVSANGVARPSAIFAVTGAGAGIAAERIAEALRSTPGVRDVESFGTTRNEVDVRLANPTSVTPDAIRRELLPSSLGTVGESSHRLPVIALPDAQRINDVPLPGPVPLRLGDVATITLHEQEPQSVAHLDGRPAVILNVFRDDSALLLTFDRAVRRTVGRNAAMIWSDAAEVRTILVYATVGAAAATLILMLCAGWTAGAYVPLAIGLLVNVWRTAPFRVDAQTLLLSAIAIAGTMPFAASRGESRPRWPLVIAALFAWLLPIAAVFSGGALSPLLSPPALSFAIAATCAALAALLIPPPAVARWPLAPRLIKRLLRNPASVVLACLAIAILFLSWFGPWLSPRRSKGSADRSYIFVRAEAPSGTTLAQTIAAARPIEDALRRLSGVKRFWTSIAPAEASVMIETDPSVRQPARFERFQNVLRSRLPLTFGSVTILGSSDRSAAATLPETIEEQPYTDELGRVYRFLLKGTDADVLRRTAEAMATRIARAGVARGEIHTLWPQPSPRIDLVPRAKTHDVANAAAEELRLLTLPPDDLDLPDGSLLHVARPDAPKSGDDVPRRADLFARPLLAGGQRLTVESAFDAQPAFTQGAVTRELGRFVLPVEVDVRAMTRELTIAKRNDIDRTVSLAPLPAGVAVDRPQTAPWRVSVPELRLEAVAAFLPLLLFALAAIVTGSFTRTFETLAPAAVALAFVAPILAAASASLDEMTLLATGAALCGVTAFSAAVVLRTDGSVARTLRTVRPLGRPVAAATLGSAALLFLAAGARSAMGDGWRAPLLAAGTVFAVGIPTSLMLPSAVALLLRHVSRRRVTLAGIASPAEWSDPAASPQLSVRNLTKVYPGGFTALRRVSFDLTPGIVGLLGPNGAGKTTLLRILTGLLQPTRGHVAYRGVRVRAENLARFQRSIGFLPQEFNAYAGLTAEDFLDYWALERGIDRASERQRMIEHLLRVVALEGHAGRRVRDFSGGMRQRIGIARALLGDPPLLIVDEPTTGLDIEARRRFRDLLLTLAADRIVILSSHIASDIESTATRLLLLVGGRLQWDGSLEGLLARAEGRVFEQVVSDAELLEFVRQYRITARVRVADGIRVRGVAAPEQRLPGLAVKPTLEDAYLAEVSRVQPAREGRSFSFIFQRA
jgi:ABC-2 type transport system ATP-binding protein